MFVDRFRGRLPLLFLLVVLTTALTASGATLTTTASGSVPLGGAVSDSAVLAGGVATPSGSITFSLYGPNNVTCSGAAIFTTTVPVSGNGTYNSGSFTPSAVGTYNWIAGYSGDPNNLPVTTTCGDANETV